MTNRSWVIAAHEQRVEESLAEVRNVQAQFDTAYEMELSLAGLSSEPKRRQELMAKADESRSESQSHMDSLRASQGQLLAKWDTEHREALALIDEENASQRKRLAVAKEVRDSLADAP